MNKDLYWNLAAINMKGTPGMRRDVFTYCYSCKTRTHFEARPNISNNYSKLTCHTCGDKRRVRLAFPLGDKYDTK